MYIYARYRWLRENNLAGEYVADTSEGSEAKLMTVDEVRTTYIYVCVCLCVYVVIIYAFNIYILYLLLLPLIFTLICSYINPVFALSYSGIVVAWTTRQWLSQRRYVYIQYMYTSIIHAIHLLHYYII